MTPTDLMDLFKVKRNLIYYHIEYSKLEKNKEQRKLYKKRREFIYKKYKNLLNGNEEIY